ncbi:MAG: peptide-binding protein [Candidatus Margulisiibacteriota bacterium]|jgi:peptide/nickel transport system substrate-binding protein
MNKTINLLFVIFILVFIYSCGKPQIKLDYFDNTLKLNLGAEPSILNPILFTDGPSAEIVGLIFNGLFKVAEDLSMKPDLVASYKISSDGKIYIFKLRQDIFWHDGKKFTCDDVIFTFQKLFDLKTNTVRRSDFVISGKSIRFVKIDNYTLKAILPEPFAPFLVNLGIGILPKHLLNNKNINTADFNRHPIGTGPFKFVDWQTNQFVKLSRNDAYYFKKPKIARILFKIIPNENTAFIALKKGEIDLASIPIREVKRLKNNSEISIYNYYPLSYTYLGFNLKNPILKDLRVRQAIALAIDRKAMIKAVLRNFGKVAYVTESPYSWAYPDLKSIDKYTYNPEKTKKLLENLGYQYNQNTKFFEKDGKILEFTIITNKGNVYREKTAEIIQQFLARSGIKVNIQLMEWSSFIKVINEPKDPKDFDLVLLGWSLSIDPDSYSLWYSKEYPRGFNFIGYNNKIIDELLVKERQSINKAERKKVFQEIYQVLAFELPYYTLYYPEAVVGVNNRVRNLSKPSPLGVLFNIEDIYITNENNR